MKRKMIIALLIAMTSLSSCGKTGGAEPSESTVMEAEDQQEAEEENIVAEAEAEAEAEPEKEVEKPEKITIMVDGTLFTKENGRDEFMAKLEELTGITFEVIQPDHDAYYDIVGQQIASGDWPDVLILGSSQMSSYGSADVLWDMSDAWENSDLKKRQEAFDGDSVVSSMYIDGHLYGMPAAHGNGCLTYIKKAWLDDAGITTLPTTYDEYYDMLLALKEAEGTDYVLAAAGFLGSESPYVNYLPEFYQDALPSFYQKADGTWADGFGEDSMKAAMQRLADAVSDGLIDPETNTYGTADVRNRFYDDHLGVFTYWAGTWASNLKNNLQNNGLDGELVTLSPIKEVGAYNDRLSQAWCITTACENPEGVFKYFIEPMQDGGEVQFLFTYGVEDVHWSTKAEIVCEGTDFEKVYADGEFHFKENIETPGSQYTKAHIDSMLALTELENDPRETTVRPEALEAQTLFNANSVGTFIIPSTDAMNRYNGDLMTEKSALVTRVALGEITVDEAYAEYESQGYADMSKAIVDSLNAR